MKKTLALLLLLAGLSVEAQGRTLYWTGAESAVWDYETANWLDEKGIAAVFRAGDAVVFGDVRPKVSICETSPASVLVDNSKNCDCIFRPDEGSDIGLRGNMSLTKKGDGNLFVNVFNTYRGNTYIHGGVVIPNVTGALGSGVVYLYGGSLDLRQEQANDIVVEGQASMGGKTSGVLTLSEQSTLTLIYDLYGSEGDAIIKDGATLDLGNNTISDFARGPERGAVHVGNSFIGNGEISGCMLYVAAGKTLTLLANTSATKFTNFNLGEGSTLDMGGNSVSFADTSVSSYGDGGYLGHGTIEGDLTVTTGSRINLLEGTTITGGVSLGAKSSLNLGGNTVTGAVTLSGSSATIGNGIINGDMAVAEGKSLVLLEHTTVTGGVSLGAKSSLDLGGNTFHMGGEGGSQVTFSGDATVSNGTLVLDSDWSPGYALTITDITLDLNKHTLSTAVSVLAGNSTTIANGTVKLLADLTGEGTIVFGEDTMVDMNGYTLSQAFSLAGDTTFTNGKVRLTDNVSGEGTFILGEGVTLDTNFRTISNKITLSGSTVTILGGNFDNDLTVGKGQTLIVTGTSMTGKGTLYLGDGATLRQKPTPISSYITNAVMVTGNATIDNGNLSSWVTVAPGVKLTVSGSLNMANSSSIALQDGAILDLGGGSDINARVYVGGDAFVGNGCVNKEILVNSLRKLTLFDSLTCIDIGSQETSTGITLQNNAAVDLGGKTHIIDVRAYGNASIGNGTLDGSVTANHDSSLNFFGETRIKGGTQIPGGTQNPDKTATSGLVTVGNTTIKSLDNANPGLLKELSVSNGLIAGTDRCTSLADGLYIKSTADLMIKNMTITANNELHAGYMLTDTVTLNQVTIDLSEANFKLVGSDYYFQVQDLINCTLEMDDVVFDASGLELPEDFDPAKNGIGFDFGDDVFIGKTEATLLMGDHWSQTVSLGDRGQMVFSALVPMTPEPTTGTLSLLALAALASRRRRK